MEEERTKEPEIRDCTLFWDYCHDRRWLALLFLLTIGIFLLVAALNHLPGASGLMYGIPLSVFLWGVFAAVDFYHYCRKRSLLSRAMQAPELAASFLAAGNGCAGRMYPEEAFSWNERSLSRLEQAYRTLIEGLCEERETILLDSEKQRKERGDYYLMWAHQIKTPIAAIKLLLEEREDGFPMLQELFKIEQYVEMVLSYLRLESISSDLLLKEYALGQIVKNVVKKFSVLFINSGLKLALGNLEGIMVLTDEKWFGLALEQILSNSIKYTHMGRISVYMAEDEVRTLVIEDTGIGIRGEDLPRIFERGFTGYNGRLDQKSTGIGLYLTKQVLDHLSIPVRVESVMGSGTKVYLNLEAGLQGSDPGPEAGLQGSGPGLEAGTQKNEAEA